ncbi:hypothetical protein HU200_031944 [Digitaria exilis]|uniref:Laccase n=1 Tax=Digitaria exilis TaxID=1010633 RepID=A0A835BLZ1_9POAL|nr:hypothetical protein HU200_031944 [Digitaria exilis]
MAGGRRLRCLSPACLFLATAVALLAMPDLAAARTRRYTFNVTMATVTRLCVTKSIPTVNGQFPGPKVVVREGDRLIVQIHNNINNNVTFHCGWADGPSYITQCPIRPGQSYAYNFRIVGQRGTLWWHAHFSWLRATLYGPLVILPPLGVPYPFPKPDKEIPLMLGEWFNADPEAVIKQALRTGGGPNVSDAYTFNGLPGPTYNCSSSAGDTFRLRVSRGKTYMLRLVNAALNDELFFAVANHTLTVVQADANYVKPFVAATLVISPGQTMDVLLTAAAAATSSPAFAIAVAPYTNTVGTFDNTTAVAVLDYAPPPQVTGAAALPLPALPLYNDTAAVANFSANFRSLASTSYPARVPQAVDRKFFFAVGLGSDPCKSRVNGTCQGPNGTRFAASMNNVSFAMPKTSLLQAHYQRRYSGVLTANFPATPAMPFNYTGTPPNNTFVSHGTRVVPLGFNTSVEVVLQDTSILGAESHPLHLHGYDFYVVGTGFGNYDANNDTAKYNLVDPVQRNTISVPTAGWVAIRFVADNPGVWIMHCHLDVHLSWGLAMAWLVNDGPLPNQKLPPPPSDIPKSAARAAPVVARAYAVPPSTALASQPERNARAPCGGQADTGTPGHTGDGSQAPGGPRSVRLDMRDGAPATQLCGERRLALLAARTAPKPYTHGHSAPQQPAFAAAGHTRRSVISVIQSDTPRARPLGPSAGAAPFFIRAPCSSLYASTSSRVSTSCACLRMLHASPSHMEPRKEDDEGEGRRLCEKKKKAWEGAVAAAVPAHAGGEGGKGGASSSTTSFREIARRCVGLVREQRARLYIARRCATMLACWRDTS